MFWAAEMLTIRTAVDAVVEPGAAAFILLGVVGVAGSGRLMVPGLSAPAGRQRLRGCEVFACLAEACARGARVSGSVLCSVEAT